MAAKKKAIKMSWQEMQTQFGGVSRNPLDNLPTGSRGGSDQNRDGFRPSAYADRERRPERREERDEGPSRADGSSAWRATKPLSTTSRYGGGGGGFDDRSRANRDDGAERQWRNGNVASAMSGSDSSARPRLQLAKPSAERIQAALEAQAQAKSSLAKEHSSTTEPFKPKLTGSNSSGDAKPVTKSNPFGDAKPVDLSLKPASTENSKPVSASAPVPKPNPFGDAKPIPSEPVVKAKPFGDAKPISDPVSKPNPFGNARPVSTPEPATKPNPFGDAKPVPSSDSSTKPVSAVVGKPQSGTQTSAKTNPFGDAKPVKTNVTSAEPVDKPVLSTGSSTTSDSDSVRPKPSFSGGPSQSDGNRFARPQEPASGISKTTASQDSSRFARPTKDEEPYVPYSSRPPTTRPVVNVITPGPPPKRTVTLPKAAEDSFKDEYPVPSTPLSDIEMAGPQIESHDLVRSSLSIAMADGSWISADELADSIASVSLESTESVDQLAAVLAASLVEKSVILASALALLPQEHSQDILERTLLRLVNNVPTSVLLSIVGDVDIASGLGIKSGLSPADLGKILQEKGLGQLAPQEDSLECFKVLCSSAETTFDGLFTMVKEKFPKKTSVVPGVSRIVAEYVILASLASKTFNPSVVEENKPLLTYVASSTKTQTQLLFGAQSAWFTRGKEVKRSGRLIFEQLFELRIVTLDSLGAWILDNKDKAEGKRSLLLQVGGFISDLQNAAAARDIESDSDESVDLDSDFPQANRNYDGY
uniref:Uncharacterized protein n=1 Tax=Spongospora subterranea TaxID=70186 RepID=A0A0H5R881_9EUKA|eukprot:CRZ10041.1 hypothetical protein [Spongospora subterranea]